MAFTTRGSFSKSEKVNLNQQRNCWFLFIVLACVIIFAVGVAVPLIVLKERDHRLQEDLWRREVQETDQCVSKLRIDVIEAISATYALGGLVYGNMKTTPPFNATIEKRLVGQDFPRFYDMASLLVSKTKDLAAYILAPGGVAFQTVPAKHNLYMYDFLAYESDLGKPTVLESIETAKLVTLGPLYRKLSTLNMTWQLIVRYPLYNVKDILNASKKNFWGFVLVVLDVESIIDKHNIDLDMNKKNLEYLIYTRDNATDAIVPIRFSGKKNATREELLAFIDSGTDRAVLRGRLTWRVCTRTVGGEFVFTARMVFTIVMVALIIVFFLFFTGVGILYVFLRKYNGERYAPKSTPFAMAVIGLCNREALWKLTPDSRAVVAERFSAMLLREIASHKAYEGGQFYPFTATVFTRNMETAVRICFAIIDGMQSQKFDEPLQELLEEGRPHVACAVHWCSNAIVRPETIKKSISYSGPDVVYCRRLWLFAAPDEVLASSAARGELLAMTGVEIKLHTRVSLHGLKGLQEFFIVSRQCSERSSNAPTRCKINVHSKMHARKNSSPARISIGAVSQGNPLFGCVASFSSAGQQHLSACVEPRALSGEATGVSQAETSPRGLQLGGDNGDSVVVAGDNNSAASVGCAVGSSPALRRVSDLSKEIRRPSPLSVPKRVVELIPTDGVAHVDAAFEECFITHPKSPHCCFMEKCAMDDATTGPLPVFLQQQQQQQQQLPLHTGGWIQKDYQLFSKENTAEVVNVKISMSSDADLRAKGNTPIGTHESEDKEDGDYLARTLLEPKVPEYVDKLLSEAFELYSVTVHIGYCSVRTIVYYFFSAFNILLMSLAKPERKNICKRLSSVFGVPQKNIFIHLAVQCFWRYIHQQEETRPLLWNCEQQTRLHLLADRLAKFVMLAESSCSGVFDEDIEGTDVLQRWEHVDGDDQFGFVNEL